MGHTDRAASCDGNKPNTERTPDQGSDARAGMCRASPATVTAGYKVYC